MYVYVYLIPTNKSFQSVLRDRSRRTVYRSSCSGNRSEILLFHNSSRKLYTMESHNTTTATTTSPKNSHKKLKLNTNIGKRPDSMKIELITIPERGKVPSFRPSVNVDSVVSVGFRDVSCTAKSGIFRRSK